MVQVLERFKGTKTPPPPKNDGTFPVDFGVWETVLLEICDYRWGGTKRGVGVEWWWCNLNRDHWDHDLISPKKTEALTFFDFLKFQDVSGGRKNEWVRMHPQNMVVRFGMASPIGAGHFFKTKVMIQIPKELKFRCIQLIECNPPWMKCQCWPRVSILTRWSAPLFGKCSNRIINLGSWYSSPFRELGSFSTSAWMSQEVRIKG